MLARISNNSLAQIRALACVLVVAVHASASTFDVNTGLFDHKLALYLNQFARVATPIFAVLSGILLFSSANVAKFDLKRFFLSRSSKVVSPFLVWSGVYLLLQYIGGRPFEYESWQSLVAAVLLGDASYHLYFISTVLQFYILFPLFAKIGDRKVLLVVYFLSLPINTLWLLDRGAWHMPAFDYFINHRSFILYWIAYFLFGGVLARYQEEVNRFLDKKGWLVALCFFAAMLSMYCDIKPGLLFDSSRVENLVTVPIAVLFLLLLLTKIKARLLVLNSLGNYSMGVYLIHPMIVYILPSFFWNEALLIGSIMLVVLTSVGIVRLIQLLPNSSLLVPVSHGSRKIDTTFESKGDVCTGLKAK